MPETETIEVNEDLDLQVLALSMRQEGAIEYFVKNLPIDDVGKPRGLDGLSELYRLACEYHQSTGSDVIDPQGFKFWLESDSNIISAVGGREGLETLFKPALDIELSTPKAITSMIRKRSQQERKRRLTEQLQEVVNDGDSQEDVSKILDRIKAINTDPLNKISESVYTGYDMAQRVGKLREVPDFLSTPYPRLNRALSFNTDGGLSRGAVYAITAASGQGKSSLAKAFVLHWVRNERNALFVNYEEDQEHWEKLFFTHITKYNAYTLHKESQEIQDKASEQYTEEMERIGDHLIAQHNPETLFYEDLEQWIRNLADQRRDMDKPLDVVVIDTLQSLFMKGSGGQQRWSQFEQMMVRLENLAKDLNVAIIITAQENNNRIKENRDVTLQSDIGGSATIVQKSTAVMVLMKKDTMDDPSVDGSFVEIQIPKNRITGETYILEPPLLRFDDESKSFEEVDIETLQQHDEDLTNITDFFS